MAEGILRSLLPAELSGVTPVVSAGTWTMPGAPAAELAIQASSDCGVDISAHRSVSLTPELLRASDLILCMEPHHVQHAREMAPDVADRVHLISELGAAPNPGSSTGVVDPMGGTADQYRDTFNRIRSHLLEWVPVIREAAERREGARRSSEP